MLTPGKELLKESEAAWQRYQDVASGSLLNNEQQQLLRSLFAVSPFIGRVAESYPEQLVTELFVASKTAIQLPDVSGYEAHIAEALEPLNSEEDAKKCLRQLRHCWMAKLAAADILQQLSLKESLAHYSAIADAAISESLSWLFERYINRHGKPLDAEGNLLPLLIIGMGKLGGRELNFSSDIDLIFAFPEQGETQVFFINDWRSRLLVYSMTRPPTARVSGLI